MLLYVGHVFYDTIIVLNQFAGVISININEHPLVFDRFGVVPFVFIVCHSQSVPFQFAFLFESLDGFQHLLVFSVEHFLECFHSFFHVAVQITVVCFMLFQIVIFFPEIIIPSQHEECVTFL